jgi:hypothetical protein
MARDANYYRKQARRAARKYGLDERIFVRQIKQESGFNPHVRSGAGAQGIAQIMPDTAKSWGVDPWDADAALDAAAKNMAGYVRKYKSYRKALAAYNAGEDAVQQYGGIPPYAETRHYVKTILGGIHNADYPGQKSKAQPKQTGSTDGPTTEQPQEISLVSQASPVPQISFSAPTPPPMLDASQHLAGPSGPTGQGPQPLPATPPAQVQTPELPDVAVPSTEPFSGDSEPTAGAQQTLPTGILKVKQRAEKIDSERRKYLYGGGHGTPSKVGDGKPIDCSASVSMALGIDTQVSGAFGNWGKPGKGKGKNVVNVYYNGGHVFMEINGKFWGTSRSNPGGGPGWIPRSQMNAGYIKDFKVRHMRY